MEIAQNVWLALNIIFGLWSGYNWFLWLIAVFTGATYRQSQLGAMLDLIIPSSCLAYYLTFH